MKWELLLYGRGKAGSQGGGLVPEKTPLKVSFFPLKYNVMLSAESEDISGIKGEE